MPAVVDVSRGAVAGAAGVVGVVIGSFLNVVAYRVPRRLSVVGPRSFCPQCEAPIGGLDNVPLLSWVVLRGRCRRCRAPISVRYPLVEAATGILFAAVGWGFGPHGAAVGYCVLAASLLVLVVIALDGDDPPLSVAVVGAALADLALVVAGMVRHHWASVVGVAVASVVGAGLVVALRRGAAGAWRAAAPVVLPAAVALGWLGGAYVGEGAASAAVGAVLAWNVAHRGAASLGLGRLALTLGLAFGAAAATATALALGAAGGR